MSEGGPDSRHRDAGWTGGTCGNERGGGAMHGVPRWIGSPARPESIGVFGLDDGQRGETVGWVGGGRASQQESSDAGRAGTRSPAGHVGRRTFVSEKQWRHLWVGADVAGLDGEVRGGKRRTMLPNCPELISSITPK